MGWQNWLLLLICRTHSFYVTVQCKTHSVLMFDLLATWLIFICSVKSIGLTPRNITCMDYGVSVA